MRANKDERQSMSEQVHWESVPVEQRGLHASLVAARLGRSSFRHTDFSKPSSKMEKERRAMFRARDFEDIAEDEDVLSEEEEEDEDESEVEGLINDEDDDEADADADVYRTVDRARATKRKAPEDDSRPEKRGVDEFREMFAMDEDDLHERMLERARLREEAERSGFHARPRERTVPAFDPRQGKKVYALFLKSQSKRAAENVLQLILQIAFDLRAYYLEQKRGGLPSAELRKLENIEIISAYIPGDRSPQIFIEAWDKLAVENLMKHMDVWDHFSAYDTGVTRTSRQSGGIRPMLVKASTVSSTVLIESQKLRLVRGSMARVSSGIYRNDYAQIFDEPDYEGGNVLVRLIPRVSHSPEGYMNAKGGADPLEPRLWPAKELKRIFAEDAHDNEDGTIDVPASADGHTRLTFTTEGFLIKNLKLTTLSTSNVKPDIRTVELFQKGTHDIELQEGIDKITAVPNIAVGDSVCCQDGEEDITWLGKIKAIVGDDVTVTVEMDIDGEKIYEDMPFRLSQVVKVFDVGQTVTIMTGDHKGARGVVTDLLESGRRAKVLIHGTEHATEVYSINDITAGFAVVGSQENQGIRKQDLVRLLFGGDNQVVMVTGKQGEQYTVLNAFNKTSTVSFGQLGNRVLKTNLATIDDGVAPGRRLRVNDQVSVISGQFEGRTAQIVQIFNRTAFVRWSDDHLAEGYAALPGSVLTSKNPKIEREAHTMAPERSVRVARQNNMIGKIVTIRFNFPPTMGKEKKKALRKKFHDFKNQKAKITHVTADNQHFGVTLERADPNFALQTTTVPKSFCFTENEIRMNYGMDGYGPTGYGLPSRPDEVPIEEAPLTPATAAFNFTPGSEAFDSRFMMDDDDAEDEDDEGATWETAGFGQTEADDFDGL
ncbi:transcription elongation factor Spt5 [Carpediemonas membranifera]|uniref:Transcription elongation factor Spt5 n=1 Tax=Carpediemonas membranifera TaxID=201153 RepID=A0A8J6E4G7_9EUKA|nr:transcription elongation factor Spt5 [Carpediemonas membranifera]|eukprot:KAG9396926.1 transcription elongation factor Spt5 [Carpediemonas membranifera]